MKKLLLLLLITPALGFSQFDFLPFEIVGVEKIYDDDFYIVPEGKILVLYGDNSVSFRFKDNLQDYEIGGGEMVQVKIFTYHQTMELNHTVKMH